MKIEPNLGKTFRILYGIVGLVIIVLPFTMPMATWIRVVVPILGVLSIATAFTGW